MVRFWASKYSIKGIRNFLETPAISLNWRVVISPSALRNATNPGLEGLEGLGADVEVFTDLGDGPFRDEDHQNILGPVGGHPGVLADVFEIRGRQAAVDVGRENPLPDVLLVGLQSDLVGREPNGILFLDEGSVP